MLIIPTGQHRTEIQQWLSPSAVQDDLFRHENEGMPGSCEWALETPQVCEFLASTNSRILRIGGSPGIGKSTLAAFLVRHIIDRLTFDCFYFFCKAFDERRRQPFQVLRTLLSQILVRDPSLYALVEPIYQQSGQKSAESFATLQHSLLLALRNTAKSPVYLIVDALDECQDTQNLISCLTTASQTPNKIVKVILTSREDPDLIDMFQAPPIELVVSSDMVETIVSQYVKQRVANCKQIKRPEIAFQVHRRVSEAAKGLWLYARLMMDEIQRSPSPTAIERQLRDIPFGLAQIYKQIFETMVSSFSPLQLRLCQQVFLWAGMVKFVDVGRSHLVREVLDIVLQAANDGEEVFDSMDLARQLCSPLMGLSQDEEGQIHVAFVHQTAAQFVERFIDSNAADIPVILRPLKLKQLYHGETSAWYFEESPKSNPLLEFLRSHPYSFDTEEYFEMAYGLWDAYFMTDLPANLSPEDISEASRLCQKMTDFLWSGKCLVWIEMAIIINYAHGYPNLYMNALEAIDAAENGLTSSYDFFRQFSVARRQFFEDYAYVIGQTGPMYGYSRATPEGLTTRPVARQLMELGQRWGSLMLGQAWTTDVPSIDRPDKHHTLKPSYEKLRKQ